jgi:hypothetical protein
MNEVNTLKRKFELWGHDVHCSDYNHKLVGPLREAVRTGQLRVVKGESHDNYRATPVPFEEKSSTSTYDKCTDLCLRQDTGLLELTVWNGDNLWGERTTKRSTYTFAGEWWMHPLVVQSVASMFHESTRQVLRTRIEEEMEARRQAIEDELLGKM